MNKTDPICGMQGTIPAHGKRFCSQHCVHVYEKQEGIVSSPTKKDNKRIAYLLIAVIVGGGIAARRWGYMVSFMGRFFVVVGCLKLLDLKGFVEAYSKYDLVAMQYRLRGRAYPFVEIAVGVAFLLGHEIRNVAGFVMILMLVGTIGVAMKLSKNEHFQCACLGTKLNVPLTNLTLVEDILMLLMAAMIYRGGSL